MRKCFVLAAAIAVVGLSAAQAAVPAPIIATAAPAGSATRPIAFTRIAFQINSGTRIGSMSDRPLCLRPEPMSWKGDEADGMTAELAKVFASELSKAGFKAAGDPSNLFEAAGGAEAEYAVAGLVKGINVNVCYPFSSNDISRAKGEARLTVEWQVYSRLKREVIGKVEVVGAAEVKESVDGGAMELMRRALGDSVRGLINSEVFRQAALGGGGATLAKGQVVSPGVREPIVFAKPTRKPAALADVVGSVVTVLSGDGHGSGFLISDDGYVLTNRHVTAGAKYVKIRWSDRLESVGEVIREDKGRDVALIKTDARGRTPLTLRRGAPEIGSEVYAVGAPLEVELQGTVTRGIVSAGNRVFDNYSYIQSDVTVNPGNSGGPLVTKDGDVVGLTVSGLRPDGAPSGVNLFIPAGDAMDFLSLR